MAVPVVADTQAVVWYLGKSPRLSQGAFVALDGALVAGVPVYVCTITLVEIIYLIERQRLSREALERLLEQAHDPDSSLTIAPLDETAAMAVDRIPREQVPDMPDRIIAATAAARGVPLVTSDSEIRALSNIETIW